MAGYTLQSIDQSAYAGHWVSLGTYTFSGTSADFVSLSAINYEPSGTARVGFDAMRFEPRP